MLNSSTLSVMMPGVAAGGVWVETTKKPRVLFLSLMSVVLGRGGG